MRYVGIILLIALIVVIIGAPIYFAATPSGRAAWNNWFYKIQKVDDVTSYETRKTVEDTCRAMIASYTADKLRYEQYNASDDTQQREWGEQAKMRANQTAAQYNEYILKNSYVWADNIPSDIKMRLEYINDY